MHTLRPVAKPKTKRRGLAPLEFVLALPILLFTMALMINLGTAGAWKVRAHTNARESVWSSFAGRSGGNPQPAGWPQGAVMRKEGHTPEIMPNDPYRSERVARGPVLASGQAWIPVDQSLLDIRKDSQQGFASMNRPLPLMERVPPRRIRMSRTHPVMEGTRWQYWSMEFASNLTRRALYLYPFDLSTSDGAALTQAYMTAALAIIQNPRREDLTPLEGGDPEVQELLGERSPDLQPKLSLGRERANIRALGRRFLIPANASTDAEWIQARLIERLKQRIRNVPQRLKSYYTSVYQRVIDLAKQNNQPVPPGIEQKLKQVQNFNP